MRHGCSLRRTRLAATAPLLAVLALIGCTIVIDDPGAGDGDGPPAAPTTFSVQIVNDSGKPLDPEIYVTSSSTTNPDELFQSIFKYTTFGFGNRGFLEPRDSITIGFDCPAVMTIGTRGGIFGENFDSPDGVGTQRLIVQGANFACGETLVFRFTSDNGYTTTVEVRP